MCVLAQGYIQMLVQLVFHGSVAAYSGQGPLGRQVGLAAEVTAVRLRLGGDLGWVACARDPYELDAGATQRLSIYTNLGGHRCRQQLLPGQRKSDAWAKCVSNDVRANARKYSIR